MTGIHIVLECVSTRMNLLRLAVATALGVGTAMPGFGGITVFKDGRKYVKTGGRIQMQCHDVDPGDGTGTDERLFRRLRPDVSHLSGLFIPP